RAVWHVPAVFDAAARHPALHQFEHLCLFLGGAALWAVVLGPGHTGPRIAALVAFQLGGMALGLVLIWSGSPVYAHCRGLSDQRAAGALMMATGTAITFGLAAWLLLGLLREERSG
ncbi:MAG: putative rane protein, partial [Gaiellaceae bacterium]|nr:putative rane protein [Gaiellaceae bacterium]